MLLLKNLTSYNHDIQFSMKKQIKGETLHGPKPNYINNISIRLGPSILNILKGTGPD